jgi:hypothetical protein
MRGFWQTDGEPVKGNPRLFFAASGKCHHMPTQGGYEPLKIQILGRLRQAAFDELVAMTRHAAL